MSLDAVMVGMQQLQGTIPATGYADAILVYLLKGDKSRQLLKNVTLKKLKNKWLMLNIFSFILGIDQSLLIDLEENLLNVKMRLKVINREA